MYVYIYPLLLVGISCSFVLWVQNLKDVQVPHTKQSVIHT